MKKQSSPQTTQIRNLSPNKLIMIIQSIFLLFKQQLRFRYYNPPIFIHLEEMTAYFAIKSYCVYTTTLFFREIQVINEQNVPSTGPCIVYSNHNNQFVDGLLLTAQIKRKISFVTAAKSMRRHLIGPMLQASEAIPVERPQDVAYKGPGKIKKIEGNKVYGQETEFTKVRLRSQLKIEKQQIDVNEIVSDTEIISKTQNITPIKPDSSYKIIPKLEYHELYHFVWEALNKNRCIGIFPEGGSHDRLELLPFKAGICIMALGAMEKYGCPVTLVPAGFNYYNPQNFRSKVIMQFGTPYKITQQLVDLYKKNKKQAISILLETLENLLKSVTIQCKTFDELSTLFLCRELYTYKATKQISIKDKLELNRRFAQGFDKLTTQPQFKKTYTKLQKFNEFVKANGLSIKKKKSHNVYVDILKFTLYFLKLLFRMFIALPGLALMGPTTTIIAYQAQKERIKCLKASDVKVRGNDVVGSYKILLSMIYFPLATILHTILFYHGLQRFTDFEASKCFKISMLVPLLMPFYAWILVKSYDSLGRSFTKLKYLFVTMFKRSIYTQFEEKKRELSREIRAMVDKYGGNIIKDFESNRIMKPEELGSSSHIIQQPQQENMRKKKN